MSGALKRTISVFETNIFARLALLVCAVAILLSMVISAYWWFFLAFGVALTIASFGISKSVPDIKPEILVEKGESSPVTTSQFLIPQNWDPNEIGIQVRRLQSNSSLVGVFVDSVIKRFVIGQDSHTAKVRIEFLKSKLEELKLSKELQSSLDELEFRRTKLEIEQLELEKKKSSLVQETETINEIAKLERERDALKIKLEITQLTKQMDEVRSPSPKEQVRPADETKRESREKKLQEIRDCEKERAKIQADATMTEDSRRRLDNMIAKKLERLHDELEKYI